MQEFFKKYYTEQEIKIKSIIITVDVDVFIMFLTLRSKS